MTSLGMCLKWAGHNVPGPYAGVPDNLLHYCDQNGLDRHDLGVIRNVAQHFGLKDNASYKGTWPDIKKHLSTLNPVIVQGNFTPSGHVIVVTGFNEETGEWYCFDPAGNWLKGYSGPNWQSGDGVWYPGAKFKPAAAPDGMVWAHFVTK